MLDSETSTLSSVEKNIFEAIEKGDTLLLKALLTEQPQNVNILDENKMTPLQHAAYKGNKEVVQILLDQGADIRLCEHQHNYTSLHFGALSGNIDVCLALLMAGAKSTEINTVGRTPSQMAAFVGHHNCVAVINNYVPKAEVEYYTKTTPTLPAVLVESFHKFIMQVNLHPVKVVLNVYNFAGLQENLQEVKRVSEAMSEREMKRGAEMNEVLSFKFHYLAYIVGEVIKLKQRQVAKKEEKDDGVVEEEKKVDIKEMFAKMILKPSKGDNLDFMDAFLKEGIREFPYRESTLFRQIVTTLSGEESPSALHVVNSIINGQRGFLDTVTYCNTCGEEKPTKKCSKCKAVQYCDRVCQRLHWPWHKKSCGRLSQEQNDASRSSKSGEAKQVDMKELQNFLVQK